MLSFTGLVPLPGAMAQNYKLSLSKPSRRNLRMYPLLPVLAVLAPWPQTLGPAHHRRPSAPPEELPARLLVSGFDSNAVHKYRDGLGRGRGTASGAQSIVRGPDGLLYVCAEKTDKVLRLDPTTLVRIDAFVEDDPLTPADENASLNGPTSATFGPDGQLYVASFDNDRILRFDGQNGDYVDVFVGAGSGGLDGPDAGTKFGADGLLYVPSFFNDRVLRYDGQGVFVDEFVSFREGGLRQPRDLVQHEDVWYVASSFNGLILRYDDQGNFLDVFTTTPQPYSLAFHPRDDNLYVVSPQTDDVRVFDGDTGTFLGVSVPAGSDGLAGAVSLFFLP